MAVAALALAQHFHRGATLWCTAPAWPQHASHVAVEFVHPVVMGKPALPAVMVSDPDLVGALRSVVSTGDIVLVIAVAGHRSVEEAMVRAQAWGATTLWVGCGERPNPGAADHVIWVDDATGTAPHDGRLVMLYHLLWELTHVCLEHPGLLDPPESSAPPTIVANHCITCADEGVLAETLTAAGADGRAAVRTPAGTEEVDTSLVGDVQPHELVLVHAGVAIETVEVGR